LARPQVRARTLSVLVLYPFVQSPNATLARRENRASAVRRAAHRPVETRHSPEAGADSCSKVLELYRKQSRRAPFGDLKGTSPTCRLYDQVDWRRIANKDEAAGVCYAAGMAATWIRPSRLPESPRFRELGNSRRIRTWNDVSKSKNSTEFNVEFRIEYPPTSRECPHTQQSRYWLESAVTVSLQRICCCRLLRAVERGGCSTITQTLRIVFLLDQWTNFLS
jgi:hypothetical protein